MSANDKMRKKILAISGLEVGNAQSGNYLSVNETGDLRLYGTATQYEDYMFQLTSGRQGATAKPEFDYNNLGFLFPRNDATEILYLSGQVPHSYREGSKIYPHLHWQQFGGSAIAWKIDYKWYNNGTIAPSAWTTIELSASTYAWTSGSLAQISKNTTGIDGTGMTISSMLLIKLYRQDDTYAGNALANQFDFHFERDSMGSKEEYIK